MIRLFAMLAGMLLAAAPHGAQAWPTRPVTVIVTLPAGSATDIAARALSERLTEQLGQRFLVENRPGASGSIGLGALVKADADGHTVMVASSSWTVVPSTIPNLSFDPIGDVAGVTTVANVPNILVVKPEAGIKSVQELVTLAKEKPGKLSYATVGVGSGTHLNAARFQLAAGIDAVAVPFRGTAQAVTDLMGGRVDYCFCPVSTVLPFIQDGKLVALATGSRRRASALPDVPTTEEAGFANSAYEFWVGVGVPRKTPAEIVRRLHAEIVKALDTPAVRKTWATLGQDVQILEPEQFDAHLRKEAADNAALVKAAKITVN